MKISIGMHMQDGPFGGGNQFGKALVEHLRQRNVVVSFDLNADDLDIILLTDPRKELRITAYDMQEIVKYLKYVNPNAIVFHRINECDERKDTTNVNQILREANQYADHTIFVSEWLRGLHIGHGMTPHPSDVIHNGSDKTIFNDEGQQAWDGQAPLKIVTHHWSSHWKKGFDIYQQLDQLLAQEPYRSKFEFTYIGNIPADFTFENSNHVEPLSGKALADALRQHHVYISGSQNDPGPNHQNEGGNCGLPFLYRPSGGLTEYCDGFGLSFTAETLEEKLLEMANEYSIWREKIREYPYSATAMVSQYHEVFQTVLADRERYLNQRQWLSDSPWLSLVRKVNQWRR